MKLRTLLKLQKAVEERDIPYDVLKFDSVHHSQSKDMTINILDLHLTHAIRILNNYLTDDVYPRYSNRKEINILDLHLTHAIRILNNYLTDDVYPRYSNRKEINDHLDVIKDNLDDIKEVVNK